MKKAFDSVQMMRDIRVGLSRRYVDKPQLELKELEAARKRFETRQAAAACAQHVAEGAGAYEPRGYPKALDTAIASFKKGLVSDPIDLSTLAETPPPPRSKGKRKRSN